MNKLGKLIIFCVILGLVSGCTVSRNAPSYSDAPEPALKPGYAIMYVYREYAEPTMWAPMISIDKVPLSVIRQKGFTWAYIKAGEHKFESNWPFLSGGRTVKFDFEFEENKMYFFEITGTSRLTGIGGVGFNTMYFETISEIESQSSAEGIRKLEACCRYVSPKNSEF